MRSHVLVTRLSKLLRSAMGSGRLTGLLYVSVCERYRIEDGKVLLESHQGRDFLGNPFHIAKLLLTSERTQGLKLVVVCPKSKRRTLPVLFQSNRVQFVPGRSFRYAYHLATARFLVNDVAFPPYFSRRDAQKYLNTWHGTPIKALGRKQARERFHAISNTQRNLLHATDILSPNPHTENVLLQDLMIGKIWSGRLIRCGYPRNDVLFNSRAGLGLSSERRVNVALMPTWQGTFATVRNASRKQLRKLEDLITHLDESLPPNITVWVRLHPLAEGEISFRRFAKIRAFPIDVEPYEHLANCDVLVTDYSSALFDFICTQRPILLYTQDADNYRQERSFCLAPESLPFEQFTTPEDLAKRLAELSTGSGHLTSRYPELSRQFTPHDDGQNTKRVCEQFFLENSRCEVRTIQPDPHRKNILLFGSSFLNSGVTTSLKALLSTVDLERLNVVLWVYADAVKETGEEYFSALDERIDYIATTDFLAVAPGEAVRTVVRDFFAREWDIEDRLNRSVWQREWKRKFGHAHFDTLIHFTGYERGLCLLFAGCPARKVIYVHNDMAAELKAGRMSDARALKLAYQLADVVATVRKGVENPYCRDHYDYSPKITFVPNLLGIQCRELSKAPLHEAFRNGDQAPEFGRVSAALELPNRFRFINVARFSPEKGQIKLIDAFERIWSEDKSVQLYIVGGHGLAHDQVLIHARKSAARDSIIVILGSGNPFPIFARMDAFVLSSNYEGRPMVLYEAFALGLPVISTDIPGPAELLNEGYGLVVRNNVEGLAQGMSRALRGQVPQRQYDFDAHNRFALQQFYKAAGV